MINSYRLFISTFDGFSGNISGAYKHLVHIWCTQTNKVYKKSMKIIYIISILLLLYKFSSSNSLYYSCNKKDNILADFLI
jgi:hypothetical protein